MNKILILPAFLFILACSDSAEQLAVPAPDPNTRVTIEQGELVGFSTDSGAHVWRGVYYGADTSGENRWRAPRPAPKWSGTKEAVNFAPVCPQVATPFTPIKGFVNGRLEGSEDCLALDIYTPPDAKGEKLPVMVWIHGGSNVSGASQLYIGDNLAVNEDVIVVSVQYRLGPFGWFSYPALRETATTPRDKAANFGLLDLVASLEWVKGNIGAFGGNAENVTIFGESAGGHNVAALLASPLAEGLFHRAILQSGSFDSVSVSDAEGETGNERNSSNGVVERLGGSEKFHTVTTKQAFDAFELVNGFMSLPRVIEDGVSLPSSPLRSAFASTETFNAVPIITGTNRDELKLFYLTNPLLTDKKFGYFYVAKDEDLYNAAAEYASRVWRLRAVDQPAQLMTDAGHDQVYAYRFDWDEGGSLLWTDLAQLLGAGHAVEVPFVLNRFQLLGDADSILFEDETLPSREKLSRAMGSYWASFARDGVPGNSVGPQWPVYGNSASLLHFDSDRDMGIQILSGAETVEKLIEDMARDTRIDQDQRCQIADALNGLNPSDKERLAESVNC